MNDCESKYGPPPPSGADWRFAPRPGRHLDAADVRLADEDSTPEQSQGVFRRLLDKIVSRQPETTE